MDIDVPGWRGGRNTLHLFDLDTVDDSIIEKGIIFDKTDVDRCLTLFLYPDDSDEAGQLLRVYHQYFMVSNTAQLILKELEERGFSDYLQQDPLYEVILTSHGYTLMAWGPERNQWHSAEFMAMPEDLMNNLLDAYASFREEQITNNNRDLTQQEEAELKKECAQFQNKC